MSEKIYAWLLRLFPSRFRKAYGEEALQLVRDRCRDEPGLLLRLRLWLDLLGDLALSVPRAYFPVQPELTAYAAPLRSGGGPAFLVREEESLGPGALFFGGLLTLAAVVSFSVLLNHGVKHVPLSALIRPAPSSADHRSSSFSPRTPELARDSQQGAIAPANGQHPEMAASSSGPENSKANDAQSNGLTRPDGSGPRNVQSGQRLGSANAAPAGANLNRAERQRVVRGAAANLEKHYIDPVLAQKTADALREHEKNGDDDAVTDSSAFAELLTRQMRDVSHDRHLEVLYSEPPLPRRPPAPSPPFQTRYRKAMEQANCTFEPVRVLPHNIGYLKLNSFPDVSVCQHTAEARMASLNHADAVIIDLRDNRGGSPGMVMLIAAYLFDHPEYMYNPRENTTKESWTRSPVPGNRLADKPVFVLTSGRTFSGAEHFSYDLKMLKRATLVGETTGGTTDVGTFHRLDDHFGIGIRETTAINPYSEPDWAGIGVQPDVGVKAADALEMAVRLAESKLQKK
jgi:Peptidase family S41/N-terminal domain of Peptidase_S41 in eukaryotic IRBP